MPHILSLPAGLAALALAACGVAGAATLQGGSPLARSVAAPAASPAPQPLTCALVIRDSGGAVTVAGRLTSATPATGSYALRIIQRAAGGSSQITQGGDFVAAAGQPVMLGEAQFTGRASDLAAALSVEIGGRTIDCPATAG